MFPVRDILSPINSCCKVVDWLKFELEREPFSREIPLHFRFRKLRQKNRLTTKYTCRPYMPYFADMTVRALLHNFDDSLGLCDFKYLIASIKIGHGMASCYQKLQNSLQKHSITLDILPAPRFACLVSNFLVIYIMYSGGEVCLMTLTQLSGAHLRVEVVFIRS